MAEDQEELLRILEAHGKQFLDSFASPISIGKRKEAPVLKQESSKKRRLSESSEDQEEEWTGFSGSGRDDEEDLSDEEEDIDEVSEGSSHAHGQSQPHVVVFSEKAHTTDDASARRQSKAKLKAFMSSKVSKITQHVQDAASEEEEEDEDDELTNAQNDALLHRLVHTQILSGSLNPELNLDSVERKKALAGRVLEVAGKAKLGKGEKSVRIQERNKAAKFVREGIAKKQKERSQKELEEAKQLGNYHPALKQLYDASASQQRPKKREKGLKMGVGSFRGGILRLSKDEIRSVEGGRPSRGRGRGSGPRHRK